MRVQRMKLSSNPFLSSPPSLSLATVQIAAMMLGPFVWPQVGTLIKAAAFASALVHSTYRSSIEQVDARQAGRQAQAESPIWGMSEFLILASQWAHSSLPRKICQLKRILWHCSHSWQRVKWAISELKGNQAGRESEPEEDVLAFPQCARQRLHFMCPAAVVLNKAQTEDHKALELKQKQKLLLLL